LAHRFDGTLPEPAEAAAALAHVADCARCAGLVVELDPSLTFSRLRAPHVEANASDPDIESMRAAVAHLRRVSSSIGSDAILGGRRRGVGASSRRFVAAAGLVAALVGALAFGFGRDLTGADAVAAQPSPPSATLVPVAASFGPPLEGAEDDWRLSPVVESLDRSDARVYKIDDARDLSVTMIVDASFDV
jgi:hypothetical protein